MLGGHSIRVSKAVHIVKAASNVASETCTVLDHPLSNAALLLKDAFCLPQ